MGREKKKSENHPKKPFSDPLIQSCCRVDSALPPVAATRLKWSSNSYYKAINLWVLTFASPRAICLPAEGGHFKVVEFNVYWGISGAPLPPCATQRYSAQGRKVGRTTHQPGDHLQLTARGQRSKETPLPRVCNGYS